MVARRTVLAAIAATPVTVAGCQSVPGERGNGLTYALDVDSVGKSLVAHTTWAPPEGDVPWILVARDAWRTATGGGTYVTYGYAPVPGEEYTVREGWYYLLQTTVTGQKDIERPVLRLEWVGHADELAKPPDAVDYQSLPPLDRKAVEVAFFAARARESGGGAPWELVERGGYVYRHLTMGRSELVTHREHRYVNYEGVILRVRAGRETLPEPKYETTAKRVANSKRAFARVVDAALVDARLSGASLSAEARQLITTATGAGAYRETTPLSSEFRETLRALHLRRYLSLSESDAPTGESDRYLEFDGTYYTYALFVSPPEDENGM